MNKLSELKNNGVNHDFLLYKSGENSNILLDKKHGHENPSNLHYGGLV